MDQNGQNSNNRKRRPNLIDVNALNNNVQSQTNNRPFQQAPEEISKQQMAEQAQQVISQMARQQYQPQQQTNEFNEDNEFDDVNTSVTDDINRSMAKKKQEELEKEELKQQKLVNKQNKLSGLKKAILIVGSVAAVIAILAIVLVVVKKNNTIYEFNLIDSGIIVAQQPVFEDNSGKFLIQTKPASGNESQEASDETGEQSGEDVDTGDYQVVVLTKGERLKVGQTLIIDTMVNTKEINEETFTDHYTQYFLTYSAVENSYDKVKEIVDEHNESSSNQFQLPSKNDYTNANLQPLLIEFTVSYQDNFPTYNSEGKVFNVPRMSTSVKGLCQEELAEEEDVDPDKAVLIDGMIYDLVDFSDLNEPLEEADIHEQYKFRFLTSIPVGTTDDIYQVNVNISTDRFSDDFIISIEK